MPVVALYDASVLYPSTVRDLLIRLAREGLVRARWSEEILDEVFGSLARQRPDLDPVKLARTRRLMNLAVADACVRGYHDRVERVRVPDPDDRHVVAAAVAAGASVIVTDNVRHFPAAALSGWGIEACSADAFVHGLWREDPVAVASCVVSIARAWRNPRGSVTDVMERLHRGGLVTSVEALSGRS